MFKEVRAATRLKRLAMLLVASLALAAAVPAHADAQLCRQLQADLAAAASGGIDRQLISKHDAARATQRDQIRLARARARRAGCSSARPAANALECAAISAKIADMLRNLDKLERARAELTGTGLRNERNRILAAIDANDCRNEEPAKRIAERAVAQNDAPLFDQLFGEGIADRDALDDEFVPEPAGNPRHIIISPRDNGSTSGEFRTLCVRTCDGYFFPMSNAASLGDFERDQKNCETSCPGVELQLYYHSAIGEQPASMVSAATGKPYSELPTAYRYKQIGKSRPVGCGCNMATTNRNFEIIAGEGKSTGKKAASAVAPAPSGRAPDKAAQTAKERSPAQDPKVRVVGPAFLPDPQEAIDLQAPGPTPVR